MAKGKKRGGHGGDHENHERWLLTYADMITLLVAFFIMLYAMSVMNITKFQQLAVSVRSGFGGSFVNGAPTIIRGGGGVTGKASIVSNGQNKSHDDQNNASDDAGFPEPVPTKASGAADKERGMLDKIAKDLVALINKHGLGKQILVNNSDERGVVIVLLTDKVLFDSGRADLLPAELPILSKIAALLRTRMDNQLHIEGHTDNLPIHNARFDDNWDLSAARAISVLHFLGSCGIPEERMEEIGYGDELPRVPNDTDDDRRQNRRVEIVIVPRYPNSQGNKIVGSII